MWALSVFVSGGGEGAFSSGSVHLLPKKISETVIQNT